MTAVMMASAWLPLVAAMFYGGVPKGLPRPGQFLDMLKKNIHDAIKMTSPGDIIDVVSSIYGPMLSFVSCRENSHMRIRAVMVI